MENVAYKYTHYDLHTGNVIIKNIWPSPTASIPYVIEGDTVFIQTDFIASIIDFGFGFVGFGGETYGHYGAENMGVSAVEAFPMYDLFKFIVDSYYKVNDQVRDTIKVLFTFFTNISIDDVIGQWRHGRPFLPNIAPYRNLTLVDFYNFIQNTLPNLFTNIVKRKDEVNNNLIYGCDYGRPCDNEKQITQFITNNNNNYNDLDIFSFYDLMTETRGQTVIRAGREVEQDVFAINGNNRNQAILQYQSRLEQAKDEFNRFVFYYSNLLNDSIDTFSNTITLTALVNKNVNDDVLATNIASIAPIYLVYTAAVAKVMEAVDNLALASKLRAFMFNNFKLTALDRVLAINLDFNKINNDINYKIVQISNDINLVNRILIPQDQSQNNILFKLYQSIKWFAYELS